MKEITDAIAALEIAKGNQTPYQDDWFVYQKAVANLTVLRDAVPPTLDEAIEAQIGGPDAIEAFFQKYQIEGGPNNQIWKAARLLADAVKETKE